MTLSCADYPDLVEILTKAWDNYAKSICIIRPDTAAAYAKHVVGRK